MKDKTIRVGMLSMRGNFDKSLGKGPQRYAYELYENLARLGSSNGLDVQKVEFGVGESDLTHKVSFTLMSPFKNLLGYDILHLPAPIMFNPPITRGLIVTTVHELVVVPRGHLFYLGKQRFYEKLRPNAIVENAIRRQILSSDYIIAVSEQAKEEAVKLGYQGRKVAVINNGVDNIFLSAPPRRKRNGKKFVIGYIGALSERKNVKFAIDAMGHITGADVELEVWGRKSGEYEKLAALAARDRRIKFMGFAPEGRLVETYDRFDAFVFPSVYESHSLTILEARARGLPVILYKGGNLSQENREFCFEAKSPGHMAQILMELKENGYSESARKKEISYSSKFTWERCALETIKFYKKIA